MKFPINRKSENGDSELVTMLFITPIVLAMIFVMISVGMYFSARAQVQNANRDGARIAANWGGTTASVRLNPTGKDVSVLVQDKLKAQLPGTATTSCTVLADGTAPGGTLAKRAGQPIRCTTSYLYAPVASGLGTEFGFKKLFDKKIVATETAFSEVGY